MAAKRPRTLSGTNSRIQGYMPVSAMARQSAKAASTSATKRSVASGPYWLATQGVSSRQAVTALRAPHSTTKVRL